MSCTSSERSARTLTIAYRLRTIVRSLSKSRLVGFAAALCVGSVPAAFADGFNAAYELRIGDIDSDGGVDLYLKYAPHVAMVSVGDGDYTVPVVDSPRTVADSVLRRNASGGFDLRSPLSS